MGADPAAGGRAGRTGRRAARRASRDGGPRARCSWGRSARSLGGDQDGASRVAGEAPQGRPEGDRELRRIPRACASLIARTFPERAPPPRPGTNSAPCSTGSPTAKPRGCSAGPTSRKEPAAPREALKLAVLICARSLTSPDPAPTWARPDAKKCPTPPFTATRWRAGTPRGFIAASKSGFPRSRPDRPRGPDNKAVTHAIDEAAGQVREITRVGDRQLAAIVEYAFGGSDRS